MIHRLRRSEIIAPLKSKSITVVIPAFNEEPNLVLLLSALQRTFEQLGFTLSVLLVDDGSTDNSIVILSQLQQQYPFLQVISHPVRKGVTAVWTTALQHIKTDWILWEQADLESNPEIDIPQLLYGYQPGVDAVAGWRQGRQDGKVVSSALANFACRLAFGLTIHDMNWIKLVRRDIVANLPLDIVTHRYLLAVLAKKGYKIIEVPTPWHPRKFGSSKFGQKRLWTSSLDFIRVWLWFYAKLFPKTIMGEMRKNGKGIWVKKKDVGGLRASVTHHHH